MSDIYLIELERLEEEYLEDGDYEHLLKSLVRAFGFTEEQAREYADALREDYENEGELK
jgi:hypothetical protein